MFSVCRRTVVIVYGEIMGIRYARRLNIARKPKEE